MPPRPPVFGRVLTSASTQSVEKYGRLVVAAWLVAISPFVLAETLGDARQLSRLGEPLRLSIPVASDAGEPLSERCIALISPRESDGLPHILTARVAIARQGTAAQVLVSTATPVREPVIRLLMRANCAGASRVYTLFLEPPGSGRVIRAIGQAGPRLPDISSPLAAAPGPAAGVATTERAPGIPYRPAVTLIPVVPAGSRAKTPAPDASLDAASKSAATPAAAGLAAAAEAPARAAPLQSANADSIAAPTGAMTADQNLAVQSTAAAGMPRELATEPAVAAVTAENLALKQQLAELNGALQRMQNGNAAPASAPAAGAPAIVSPLAMPRAAALATASRWEVVWPVAIALVGLGALTLGGFMWRRRHGPGGEEWPLTGPPSHRVVSRTSLGEQPVPFKQAGVRTDIELSAEPVRTSRVDAIRDTRRDEPRADSPPAPLLLQPSADDLGRDLEHELVVAERSHSALERSHPELVEMLANTWGTAAARSQLAALLAAGSPEMSRMPGEAVGELRLLLRIADDLVQRHSADARTLSLTPPAPAW